LSLLPSHPVFLTGDIAGNAAAIFTVIARDETETSLKYSMPWQAKIV